MVMSIAISATAILYMHSWRALLLVSLTPLPFYVTASLTNGRAVTGVWIALVVLFNGFNNLNPHLVGLTPHIIVINNIHVYVCFIFIIM
jgi:hypothetical protein